MKNEKGITLIGLVVTIIVLIILAGIGIGNLQGEGSNTDVAQDQILIYELTQVQNMVLEEYLEYQNTGGQSSLQGMPISWAKAYKYLVDDGESETYSAIDEQVKNDDYKVTLGMENYDNLTNVSIESYYFSLDKNALRRMGFDNIKLESVGQQGDDGDTPIFIVNYSTGEVFNIVFKVTSDKEPLYIRAK